MQLVLSKVTDLPQIYAEMQKSFCLDEIRDFSLAKQVYAEEEYHLYHICKDEERVGFIAIWEFADFAFIEHFVIYEVHRNKGFGAEVIALLRERYTQLVLEAEPPKEEMAVRRFGFYKRLGFIPNARHYMQPSYRENGNEVHLVLMSYPCELKNVNQVIKTIYTRVYNKQYEADDD